MQHQVESHLSIEPSILYFGTPVILISTLNEDGTSNIAPISSVWWLGWSCMIGVDASSKTSHNLLKQKECVINLPSTDNIDAVNALARITGTKKVPLHKKALGYKTEANKFDIANLTPLDSIAIKPKRIKECPIQLEGMLVQQHDFATTDPKMGVPVNAFEIQIKKVHALESVLFQDQKVDPNKWNPLIMNFRELYGLTSKLGESRLKYGPEELYAPWKFGTLGEFFTKRILNRTKQAK